MYTRTYVETKKPNTNSIGHNDDDDYDGVQIIDLYLLPIIVELVAKYECFRISRNWRNVPALEQGENHIA